MQILKYINIIMIVIIIIIIVVIVIVITNVRENKVQVRSIVCAPNNNK